MFGLGRVVKTVATLSFPVFYLEKSSRKGQRLNHKAVLCRTLLCKKSFSINNDFIRWACLGATEGLG